MVRPTATFLWGVLLLLGGPRSAAGQDLVPASFTAPGFSPIAQVKTSCSIYPYEPKLLRPVPPPPPPCEADLIQGLPSAGTVQAFDPTAHFSWVSSRGSVDLDLVAEIANAGFRVGTRNVVVSPGLLPQVGDPIDFLTGTTQASLTIELSAQAESQVAAPSTGPAITDFVLFGPDLTLNSRFLVGGPVTARPIMRVLRGDRLDASRAVVWKLEVNTTPDPTYRFLETVDIRVTTVCGLQAQPRDCVSTSAIWTPRAP